MIPPALMPLTEGPWASQFIVWRPQPGANKIDKIPVDWRTGRDADAHDPTIWIDYWTAYVCSPDGVGFVLTDNDPFFVLDIDHCLMPDNTWSPLARELIAALPDCAVEVSYSGTGLHLWGIGRLPEHRTRDNHGLRLELYHARRFIALGRYPQLTSGSLTRDSTAAITAVIERYFSPKPTVSEAAWSSAPVAGWLGPDDDEVLIRRALASKGAASAFGTRASFAQLWNRDVPALRAAYPDPARDFDESSADRALAQHLCFWTGKNCDRILRIMQRSKLVRPKWEREDYLRRTILGAVADHADNRVLQDKPAETVIVATAPQAIQGNTFLSPEDQQEVFKGCVYVTEEHRIFKPGSGLLDMQRFNALLGNYAFVIDRAAGKLAKSAWDAFHSSKDIRWPHVHGCIFDPRYPTGHIIEQDGLTYVNSYFPIVVQRRKGNPEPFLTHVRKLLPDARDRDILLAYMAAVVQHQGVKFQWTPLVQGVPGNGKTLLSRVLMEAVGKAHTYSPRAKELGGRFNDWLYGHTLITVEDIYSKDSQHQAEILESIKPMITDTMQEIESKGGQKITRPICANFFITSNHKDAVQKTRNDRRFGIFFTDQQKKADLFTCGMTGDYFPTLYRWLENGGYAIVTDYLMEYVIPNELNPAHKHTAPDTSSTEMAIHESMGYVEQEVQEAIAQDRVGFRDGWVSSHYLQLLLKELNCARWYSPTARRDMMESLGYIPHPGVENGRPSNPIQPDGCRSVLFVHEKSPHIMAKGAEVARRYTASQQDQEVRALYLAAATGAPPTSKAG